MRCKEHRHFPASSRRFRRGAAFICGRGPTAAPDEEGQFKVRCTTAGLEAALCGLGREPSILSSVPKERPEGCHRGPNWPPEERWWETDRVARLAHGDLIYSQAPGLPRLTCVSQETGSRGWTRTTDHCVNSARLYQLSYPETLKRTARQGETFARTSA